METNTEKKWYAIRTAVGSENKIKRAIDNEVEKNKLEKKIGQVLVPSEKVVYLRKGKKVEKEKSYYSGYIIIETILDGEVENMIKSIKGVQDFVGIKGKPSELKESDVNRILGTIDTLKDQRKSIKDPFSIGESVNVTDGPFTGFVGTIEEVSEEKMRLKISVKIFGRKTPLELSYGQVERI
jgi:transcriptional antiterminator NusG